MKWLRLLLVRRKRTPMPPKPYVDTSSPGRHMVDKRLYDMGDLKNIDPEKPHWQDPRYETREEVPFFDFFGFNRDWSWSLFKLSLLLFGLLMYWEIRMWIYTKDDGFRLFGTPMISPIPSYARDDKDTEEELKKAGYTYIGVKNLDNLGLTDSLKSPPTPSF
ncbi:unnamed protein product [Phytomonas sp. Hart1]|nr:unnamed protein product [Phytomonas sp. Hart1]|eukprot:CCW70627.1 unnamed protein product [Phytomonas sp. isolate Hart1]